jgi:hypothetical protein
MRRGRFSAVRRSGGGGCRGNSPGRSSAGNGTGAELEVVARVITGAEWPEALALRKGFAPGTVFLQQSSAFADGAHFPFRQHSIASRVRAVAKQSRGRTSSTIASTLIAIRIVRFIP